MILKPAASGTGPPGPPGPTGPAGATGSSGQMGVPGFDGIDGEDGLPGLGGAVGPTGSTGADGRTGVAGPPGLDGLDAEEPLFQPIITAPPSERLLVHNIGARVRHSVNQSITSSTVTTLAFNTELYDNGNLHDNTTNNSRLTAPVPGKYLITTNIMWSASALGFRELIVLLNGVTPLIDITQIPTTVAFPQVFSTIYELVVGDYIEIQVLQTSGTNRNIVAASPRDPCLAMTLIQQ